jgi:antitoxin HigA-1
MDSILESSSASSNRRGQLSPIGSAKVPGDFIRTEIIAPLGLSVTAAAEVLGVSRPTLSTLLNGKADLSGDMALRIEKAFAVKMDTLMRMQSSYNIARTRQRESKVHVRRYHPAEARP